MSDLYCLHLAHLCLLLRLGSCFTLKKICQPLLCFVEWIKAWEHNTIKFEMLFTKEQFILTHQGHRYHQGILKICCSSDRFLANLENIHWLSNKIPIILLLTLLGPGLRLWLRRAGLRMRGWCLRYHRRLGTGRPGLRIVPGSVGQTPDLRVEMVTMRWDHLVTLRGQTLTVRAATAAMQK